MANTRTTLAAAFAAGDTFLTVASATGISAGSILKIDGEIVVVQKDYTSGTQMNARRGQMGTLTKDHASGAGVTIYGALSGGFPNADFQDPGDASVVNFPIAGKSKVKESLSATATLTLQPAGTDHVVELNGTSVIALTIPVPDAAKDGDELTIVSNGAAAHTLTFTGGLSGAGSSYDVITINATAPAAFKFVAMNKLWFALCGPAMGGTVTNIIGSIA